MTQTTLSTSTVKALKCKECGHEYDLGAKHVCEDVCFGPLEVVYDYDAIRQRVSRATIEAGPNSIWRYRHFLPVTGEDVIDVGTGMTPLVEAKRLARRLGLKKLFIKNDAVNMPTLSFKDRVVSVALTRARELGFSTVSCASTGNLANSTAAIAAHAGLDCCVFIPADLEAGKVLGTLIYNPTLMAVKGNYDQVNRLCSEVANTHGWGFVNINLRPYYSEGSKTLGYEVAEQLGWQLPDHIVAPLASGSLFTKIYKGFREFVDVGLVDDKAVRFSGAQAEGCSPIAKAFHEGRDFIAPEKPNTIAKSIAIGNPADGIYAVEIARKTGGNIEAVNDTEIIEGIKLLAETEGIFTETAGGTTVAVLKKLVEAGKINPDETTVVYITGNGLKTQEAVQGYIAEPFTIEPKLESFEHALERSRTLDRLEWQQVLI
ncbi:threonine synthase [Synechococcus elongatus]|uniref:Threonine synthase n=2 Tax=Synechococcus elongatus TaxID=32046 RepID=Q31MA7_SYNE7|nr:threonine synthase [Synechococcus elongatus]ABB57812.1 L-threonine synthase [Synechococcus elongatus PCC 7942 = FACHB-805]AJD57703.1 threonine synthase [Synechococcus elongatus UTEX 2973]MBD2586528.1 threonine synthase [Synechococcus elongatus FACHB-242]MBD2687602.1 threonine synthase [Synechococcus elongatus FACHB-1061]MBD2706689.1 threonine synthase [Synechococcus elongatus PCC 7942 = FACHB-805]